MGDRVQHQDKEENAVVPMWPVESGCSPINEYAVRSDNNELFLKEVLNEDPAKGVELLYRKYFQPLCSHVVKYVGSKAIAEDLVSEVFYDFYRTKAFEGIRSSFRFYLFRSARNRAWEFLKTELKQSEFFAERMEAFPSGNQNPEDITQFEEMYQDVQKAVDALPVERRRIYLMNRFEGKRYQEIAEELNLSVKTVEVQLYRANKFIRGILKAKWLLFLAVFVTPACLSGLMCLTMLSFFNGAAQL